MVLVLVWLVLVWSGFGFRVSDLGLQPCSSTPGSFASMLWPALDSNSKLPSTFLTPLQFQWGRRPPKLSRTLIKPSRPATMRNHVVTLFSRRAETLCPFSARKSSNDALCQRQGAAGDRRQTPRPPEPGSGLPPFS